MHRYRSNTDSAPSLKHELGRFLPEQVMEASHSNPEGMRSSKDM